MAKARTAHDAALAALIPAGDRSKYDARVAALVSRNRILQAIERARVAEGISKKELAQRAGLEASSVRRMLTAQAANPTAENVFRLLKAARIRVEVRLPTGGRMPIA